MLRVLGSVEKVDFFPDFFHVFLHTKDGNDLHSLVLRCFQPFLDNLLKVLTSGDKC